MSDFINNVRVPIEYDSVMREYHMPLQNSHALQGIFYCPWCGKKLPESLRNEYFAILEQEYDIDDVVQAKEAGILPNEFICGEWWKKRGL